MFDRFQRPLIVGDQVVIIRGPADEEIDDSGAIGTIKKIVNGQALVDGVVIGWYPPARLARVGDRKAVKS